MSKMSFVAKAALACALLVPVAGAAQTIESAPAVAVSMGATFGQQTYFNDVTLDMNNQAGLQSLAIAAATGARSAVANSTANGGNNNYPHPYANGLGGGATANAGSSSSDARVSSTVVPSQNNYYEPGLSSNGFESEVLIENQYYYN